MECFTATPLGLIPASGHHLFRSYLGRHCKTSLPFSSNTSHYNRGLACLSSSASTCSSVSDTLLAGHDSSSLLEICRLHVPLNIVQRMLETGYVTSTGIQRKSLPILFSGRDCVLHSQTGSGKTLAYLLSVFSAIGPQRSVVQALIIVPTRELGMQVVKVARMLTSNSLNSGSEKYCSVMALLDGGMLKRHKIWLNADPPTIVVATMESLCQMLEKQIFKLDGLQVIVIDEVDFIVNSSKQISLLRKLLTVYSSCKSRQTIFASATIPQPRRFLNDCVQHKWTKRDVVYIDTNTSGTMPACLQHRFVISDKTQKHQTLLSLLQVDRPCSGFIFVGEQSEKSKKSGQAPPAEVLMDFLTKSYSAQTKILLLEKGVDFNTRASALQEMRQEGKFLLVATDIAARGLDLPDTTHVYNFQLPGTAVSYLHRAGRTGRKPFSEDKCIVTTLITQEERFVLKRYENELMFTSEEIIP